jgi:hypothetical protein
MWQFLNLIKHPKNLAIQMMESKMEDKPNLEALRALHGEKEIQSDKDLFGFTAPSQGQLNNINEWAKSALKLKAQIEQAEAFLKGLNKELAEIEELRLPQALLEADMLEFTMQDGSRIIMSDVIQGGFPKDVEKRQFLTDWVDKEGGRENIKDHFEVHYTKGQYEDAVALRKLLQSNNIIFDEFENIHTGQLYAFLKEKLREGTMPPFEKFGLRYFKKANIKQG